MRSLSLILALCLGSSAFAAEKSAEISTTTLQANVPSSVQNRSFTVELWLRRDASSSSPFIVHGTAPNLLEIGYISDDTFRFRFGGSNLDITTDGVLGLWEHWACVYEHNPETGLGIRRVYHNGLTSNTQTDSDIPGFAGTGAWTIGEDFEGGFDDIRIWDRALRKQEVQGRYQRSLNATDLSDEALIAYWPISDGANALAEGSGKADDLMAITGPLPSLAAVGSPSDLAGDPANTITVTAATNLDPIYQAIESANLGESFTLIDLTQLSGTLMPGTLAPIPVAVPVRIVGPGFDVLTLDAGGQHRHFEVASGAALFISDLTLANGFHEPAQAAIGHGGDAGRGGSVLVDEAAHFEAERIVFQSNTAIGGQGGDPKTTTAGRGGAGGYLPANANSGSQASGLAGEAAADSPESVGGAGGIYGAGLERGRPGSPGSAGANGSPGFAYQGGSPGFDGSGGGGGGAVNILPAIGGPGGDGGDGGDGGRGGFGAGGGASGAGGGGGAGGTDNTDTTTVASNRVPEHGPGGRAGLRGDAGSGNLGGDGATATGGSGGGIWGGNAATTGRIPGGRGGQSRGGGGGAGLGGALFVGTHSQLSLRSVRFLDNDSQGGAGGEGARDGEAIGGACYMMDAAAFSKAPINVRLDDSENSNFDFAYDKIVGRSEGVLIYVGLHDTFTGDIGSNHLELESVRSEIFTDVGGVPVNNFTLTSGDVTPPDPFILYPDNRKQGEDANFQAYLIEYQLNPSDAHLAERLLDIVRDGAAIRTFIAETQTAKAEQAATLLSASQSTLEEHLDQYLAPETGILALFKEALGSYRKVFTSPATEAIFRDALPHRDFVPLTYVTTTANETQSLFNAAASLGQTIGTFVSPQPPLGTGYADLTALYQILSGYGEASTRAATLYHSRDLPGDRDLANALIEETTRTLTLTAALLESYLPEPAARPEELLIALNRYTGALNTLTDTQTKLAENVNSLGYPDDFLLLVGDHEQRDTFTKLSELFYEPGVNGSLAELNRALEALDNASGASLEYNRSLDDFINARTNEQAALQERLLELGDYNPNDDPVSDPPGEIDDQLIRINNARLQIRKNRAEMDRLHREIEIEVNRVARQQSNNRRTATIRVKYIDQQRNLDAMIAYHETSQELADDCASYFDFDPKNPAAILGIIAKGVATQFKLADANDIQSLENRKASLAGDEAMELADADNRALSIDLQAFIKNRLLDSSRIALDSRIAANNLRQEINRLAALDGERRRLLKRLAAIGSNPARLFADPIQLARLQTASTDATRRFERARLYLFMILRALEYKWNETFEQDDLSKNSLFAARNARNLLDLFDAMQDFDDLRSEFGYYDYNENQLFTLSLKKDILGFPDTAEGTTAFRNFVISNAAENEGSFSINFDTVRQFDGFFEGARYQPDGNGSYELPSNGLNRGFALNKISWLQVRAVGDFGGVFDPNNTGEAGSDNITSSILRYGGTTFIRPIRVGTLSDPQRPDSLVNELVPYETQRYDPTKGFPFQPVDGPIEDAISVFIQDRSLPFSAPVISDQASSTRFGDRSVAASDWALSIRMTGDYASIPALIEDITIIFNHSYIGRSE